MAFRHPQAPQTAGTAQAARGSSASDDGCQISPSRPESRSICAFPRRPLKVVSLRMSSCRALGSGS